VWVISSNLDISEYECKKDEKIIKMSDYDDAFEILNNEKPDVIYVIPGINAPDYAFSLAAKLLKIFRIGSELGTPLFYKKNRLGIFALLGTIGQQEKNKNKNNQILGFFYKHKFLIKTQRKIGWSFFKILLDLFSLFFIYLPDTKYITGFFPKFELDLHFVENELVLKQLVSAGFDESKIRVVGNTNFDNFFKNEEKQNNEKNIRQKYRILILTNTVFGNSKKKTMQNRNLFILEIIKKIEQIKNKNEVLIKIHPTHESLFEYRNIVDLVDPKIPILQKENLNELIDQADLIITSVSSSVAISALIMRKPIIIWNIYDVKNDILLENNLALECKNPDEILNLIDNAKKWNLPERKIEEFLSKYCFKTDGKASERIANGILHIIKK
jgi:UDP-N-acetylglucosamine:LPS N-acetylglucosamine transferase